MKPFHSHSCFHYNQRVHLVFVQPMIRQGWCHFSTSPARSSTGCLQTSENLLVSISTTQSCLVYCGFIPQIHNIASTPSLKLWSHSFWDKRGITSPVGTITTGWSKYWKSHQLGCALRAQAFISSFYLPTISVTSIMAQYWQWMGIWGRQRPCSLPGIQSAFLGIMSYASQK